jgi:hypothetical protein
MTDNFFDITQQGGVGRQPITNAGRVGYNFRLDQDDLESRKRKGASGSLWPNASMEDKSFWVLPRDICLAKKQRPLRKQTDGMMTVFSVLNGIRSNGMSHRQLIESLTFGGIAGGQGAKFDTQGNEPRHPEFAGIVGGLYTIVNNGPERIMNGQSVYWDVPLPGVESTELGRRDSRRITPLTRPYKPSSQAVTARAISDAIRQSYSSDNNNTDTAGSVTDQAAMRLKWAALQISVNATEALLASGLVKVDPEVFGANGERARRDNAASWNALRKSTRESYITNVAAGIGCRRMQGSGDDLFKMPGTNTTVKKHICDLLTFDTQLLSYTDGETIPTGNKGEVMRNQESAIKDLLSSVTQATHFVSDRIFCKALTPAAPGKEFDAVFGHYRQ